MLAARSELLGEQGTCVPGSSRRSDLLHLLPTPCAGFHTVPVWAPLVSQPTPELDGVAFSSGRLHSQHWLPLPVWLCNVCPKPCSWSVCNTEVYDSELSSHPTFAKLEGPTRQHLPGWWDNLSPSPFLGRWMFPMLDIPHSVSGHTYLTFLLGFILYLSLSCLALLLLVLTSLSPNYSFPPCGISYVFLYLCIYSVLFPHFTQFISPLQPQLLATEKQMSFFPLSPRYQLC